MPPTSDDKTVDTTRVRATRNIGAMLSLCEFTTVDLFQVAIGWRDNPANAPFSRFCGIYQSIVSLTTVFTAAFDSAKFILRCLRTGWRSSDAQLKWPVDKLGANMLYEGPLLLEEKWPAMESGHPRLFCLFMEFSSLSTPPKSSNHRIISR